MPLRRAVLRLLIFVLTLALSALLWRYRDVLFDFHRRLGQTDLLGYYSAGHLMLHGQGSSLYALDALQHTQRSAIYPLHMADPVLPYLAPPYFALFLAPVSAVSYASAYVLWLFVNFLVLAGAVLALQRYSHLPARWWPVLFAGLLGFTPVFMGLAQGQVSFLMLALFVGTFFALRAQHEYIAGSLLALALIKPPYVLPVLVLLLMHKQWRTLVSFIIGSAALLLLPLPFTGWSINVTYLRTLLDVTRLQGQSSDTSLHHAAIATATFDPHVNYSLAAFVQLLLPRPASTVTTILLTLLMLLVFAAYCRRHPSVEETFALAIVVGLLLNPHVLIHDLVLLLIPLAVALNYRHRRTKLFFSLLVIGYLTVDFAGFFVALIHIEAAVLAVVALGLWLTVSSWSNRQPTAPALQGQAVSDA